MPTEFTRSAGTIAIVGAVLWLAFPALWWIGRVVEDRRGDWDGYAQAPYFVGTFALLGAIATTLVLMAALAQRHGGLGSLGWAGLVLTGTAMAVALLAWLIVVWGPLLALGTLCCAAVLPTGIAPRLPVIAFGGAWTAAAVTWVVLRLLEVGTPDEWGDYWVAGWAGIATGSVILSGGMVGLGRWLATESPVGEQPAHPVAAA